MNPAYLSEAAQFGNLVTRLLILFNVRAVISWDVFAIWKWGPPATISWVFYEAARDHLWGIILAVMLVGIFIGHFLAPLKL